MFYVIKSVIKLQEMIAHAKQAGKKHGNGSADSNRKESIEF